MIRMVVQYPVPPVNLLIENHSGHGCVHGEVREVYDRRFSFFCIALFRVTT